MSATLKKKSLKVLQKEESRMRILNVASRLFRKQGFKATGVDQLMAEAGLTAGAFYAHFKSKEDLFEECIQYALEQARKLLVKDTEHLSGEEKNRALLKRYCSIEHRDLPDRGCLLPSLAFEIYRGPKKAADLVSNYIEKWVQLIADNLSENLTPEQKKTIALQMISRSVGAILLSRTLQGNHLSEEILSAARKS